MRWLVRAVVATSVALAGALWVAAAAQRWWPACERGDFDSAACIKLQDHLYDYVAPTAPWTPVGDAAELAGAAMVVLAFAVAVLPWLWQPVRPLVCLAVAVPAVAVLLTGAWTWRAGRTHEVVSGDPVPAILFWSFVLPLALGTAAAASRDDRTPHRTSRWRVAIAVLIGLATPLAEVVLGPLLVGYMSHDSTPWTEAVTGALLVAAACVVWPATSRPRQPSAAAQGVAAR